MLTSLDPALSATLRAMNGGRGADVVLNTAGGPMFDIGLRLLDHRGRQIEITSATERNVSFNLDDFYRNESCLIGLNTFKRDLIASARILGALEEGLHREGTSLTRLLMYFRSKMPARLTRLSRKEPMAV